MYFTPYPHLDHLLRWGDKYYDRWVETAAETSTPYVPHAFTLWRRGAMACQVKWANHDTRTISVLTSETPLPTVLIQLIYSYSLLPRDFTCAASALSCFQSSNRGVC